MTGTAGQQRVPREYFEGAELPLPPQPEQRRIVAKVDQLMALCDELEQHQGRRREKRTRLNQASLHRLTTAQGEGELAAHWRRVRENFDVLYDVPETVADLRQAVLHLAVRGKLVPQDPEDEPASVLFDRIQTERERLYEAGKMRKPKKLPPVSRCRAVRTCRTGWELGAVGADQWLINKILLDGCAQGTPTFTSGDQGRVP